MLTWMLPGCMSAWKKPSRNTCVKKMVTPSRASLGMSTPARRRRSTWLMGTPYIRSITITREVQKSHSISGTRIRSRLAMLRRSCAALAASRMRSSSSCRYMSNSATTSRGRSRLPSTLMRSTQRATVCRMARSLSMACSTLGRSTFTATSRPLLSVAKCTCAMDALATGVLSKLANTSSNLRPSSFSRPPSTSARAARPSNGGTRSCSSASSSARSAGSRSRRVDSTWPNLMKMGPSRSSAWRRRGPRGSS